MARTLSSTPKQDGFYVPGAWQPKTQCWMIRPEQSDAWPLGAKRAQAAYARVAAAIAESEPVTMCVSAAQFQNARARCRDILLAGGSIGCMTRAQFSGALR